jgi:hypothetical protein
MIEAVSCLGNSSSCELRIHTIVVKKLFDQINMGQDHSSTAVTLKTKGIQRFTNGYVDRNQYEIFFPGRS